MTARVGSATRALGAWRTALIVAFFALFALMMFSDVIASGSHTFFAGPDARDQSYVWYQVLARSIHSGYLPLWVSNAFGGFAFPGDIQPGVFYPPNVALVALFGQADGIALRPLEYFIIAHFVVASLGMFALAREWGLSRLAAAVSALTFTFSGSVAARVAAQPNIFLGLCLMPWAVFFSVRFFQRGARRYALACGAVVGAQLLAGHIQPPIHTGLVIVAIAAAWAWRRRASPGKTARALVAFFGLAGVGFVIVAAPQIIVSIPYVVNSLRWVSADSPITFAQPVPYAVFARRFVVGPAQWLSAIDPWQVSVEDRNLVFIGLVPLGLAVLATLKTKTAFGPDGLRVSPMWLLGLAGLAIVVMAGEATPLARVLHAVPGGTVVRTLGRYAIILHLCAALLAGAAIHLLQRSPEPISARTRNAAVVAGVLLAVWALYLRASGALLLSAPAQNQVLLFSAALGLAAVSGRIRNAAWIFAAAVAAGSIAARLLYISATPPPPQSAETAYAPTPITRFLSQTRGRYRTIADENLGWLRNIGLARGFETKLGYGATMYKPYFDFMNQDWSLDGRVNDLLNVRYVVARTPLPLKLVMEEPQSGLKLYERATWYPRAFFRSQLGQSAADIESQARFTLLTYSDLHIRYSVSADQTEEAIFSEVAYPGWKAYLDGRRVPIRAAAIDRFVPVLRSVEIPPGVHDVEFRFEPFWP